ncbi:MAG: glycerophosphodiester phosphodiesterase [Gemmatimonadetes bacterium]|nr:glycerophosphodiester phosphodiesterase [Gemmatimonadota bacterium]
MLVAAHRGYSAVAPENTLPAFAAALEAGARALEFDVQVSADGVPIVIHDDTVDRTTDGRGRVRSKKFTELRKLDAGSWLSSDFAGTRIPKLDEALEAVRADLDALYLELKGYRSQTDLAAILASLDEYRIKDRTVVVSFDWKALAWLREIAPAMPIGYLVERAERLGEAVLRAAAEGNAEVGCDYRILLRSPASVLAARREGVEIGAYTVNGAGAARELAQLGVTRITTDAVAEILRAFPPPPRRSRRAR